MALWREKQLSHYSLSYLRLFINLAIDLFAFLYWSFNFSLTIFAQLLSESISKEMNLFSTRLLSLNQLEWLTLLQHEFLHVLQYLSVKLHIALEWLVHQLSLEIDYAWTTQINLQFTENLVIYVASISIHKYTGFNQLQWQLCWVQKWLVSNWSIDWALILNLYFFFRCCCCLLVNTLLSRKIPI